MKPIRIIALGACVTAFAALSTGQVFAIVGYVNVNVPAGISLAANPFDAIDNTLSNLYNGSLLPDGSLVEFYSNGHYSPYQRDVGSPTGWSDLTFNPANPSLVPGQGAIMYNSGPLYVNTYAGNVVGIDPMTQDRLPVTPPGPGVYLLSSLVPLVSGFQDIVGRAPQQGDAVMFLDTAGNPLVSDFTGGQWNDPNGGHTVPMVNIGFSAFFDLTGNEFNGFVLPSGNVVPEPGTCWLLCLGMAVVAFRHRGTR